MTRTARTGLLVAVAFLVTMAVLLRSYVYGNALILPLEQRRTQHLVASAASYLDTATLRVRDRVPVTATISLYGDAAAGDERTAVWVEFATLETAFGQRIDYHERRTAFDRRTGMIVDCCEPYVDDDPRARQSGLAFRLPFAAEPREYPIYDPVLRRQVPLRFEGEETIEGLPVYRYSYAAGPAKAEDLPDVFTPEALGLPHAKGTPAFVDVSRYIRIKRTLWVEPESGLPVRVREQRTDTLRTADQVDRLVALRADLVTDPLDEQIQVAEARGFRTWVILVRDVLPVVCLALALLVAAFAWWAERRTRRRTRSSAAAQDQQQVPGHDLAQAG
ncbi:DUF3068 domain-containing protein [Thermopolyspora sp. NPDC052614]|uniref:DUF3068 domain-containing protein n=1 Tax=Thermopolyspora sp. NPDC052614 TaxID=3155682 RepID=UPI00343705DA